MARCEALAMQVSWSIKFAYADQALAHLKTIICLSLVTRNYHNFPMPMMIFVNDENLLVVVVVVLVVLISTTI